MLKARPGDANIAKAVGQPAALGVPRPSAHPHDLHPGPVRRQSLPHGLDLRQGESVEPAARPPLAGPVYLSSSCNPLPDLVADSTADPGVPGRPDRLRQRRHPHQLRAGCPTDAGLDLPPEDQGGKKGLLVNCRDLCKSVNKAQVGRFTAQNGKSAELQAGLEQRLQEEERLGEEGEGQAAFAQLGA